MFTITSCDVYTYATTQDDIYIEADADVVKSNVSFDIIIKYGTPYYYNGSLLYYLYHDIYYYPFYYNNYWYVRAYRRPFTHFNYHPYFRPHRYDYRFNPGHHRGFDRPRNPNVHQRVTPSIPPRNNDNYTRPRGSRPDVQSRKLHTDKGVRPSVPNNRSITTNRSQPRNNGGRSHGSRR